MKLDYAFYQRDDVVAVARDLLGKLLYVQSPSGLTAGRITETEAYSYREKACHAYNNRRTARTETLFADGGMAYVYLCYGIHRLFNVVTNRNGIAEAVLIRAVDPVINVPLMQERRKNCRAKLISDGPGKLSEALGITLQHNMTDLASDIIWLESDGYIPDTISKSPRIGVDYAEEDAGLEWNFRAVK